MLYYLNRKINKLENYEETIFKVILSEIETNTLDYKVINDLYTLLHKYKINDYVGTGENEKMELFFAFVGEEPRDKELISALYFIKRYLDIWLVTGQMMLKKCPRCNKWFTVKATMIRKKFCGYNCRNRAWYKKNSLRKMRENYKNNNK